MSLRYSSFEIWSAQGAVHWLIECSRHGRKYRRLLVAVDDLQLAGAELEDLLQGVDRVAQAGGADERPVQLAALEPRLAGDVHAGEVVGGGDLEVGEGLVVAEPLVVRRLDVLDQPVLLRAGRRPRSRSRGSRGPPPGEAIRAISGPRVASRSAEVWK